jgi:hypothetical protein
MFNYVENIFKDMDVDHDNTISKEEFVDNYAR